MNDHDLTPFEKEALEGLPRERTPSPFLEERVVKALRDLGVLRNRERRTIELSSMRIAAAAVAAFLLLFGGFALGRWGGERQGTPTDPPTIEASQLTVAASLQRAGSAYLSAIEELASSNASPHSDEMRQGREVALTTLYTAAGEVSRIVPKTYMASQLLRALDLAGKAEPGTRDDDKAEQVIWF